MNVLERGSLSAIEMIIIDLGIAEAVKVLDTKVVAETPMEKAVLTMVKNAMETQGLEGYRSAKQWLLAMASGKQKNATVWLGVGGPPLRELSNTLVLIQQAERGDRKRLQLSAELVARVGKPFVLALATTLSRGSS